MSACRRSTHLRCFPFCGCTGTREVDDIVVAVELDHLHAYETQLVMLQHAGVDDDSADGGIERVGAAAVDAAGIAIAIITAVQGVGGKLSTNFGTISTSLK